MLIYERTYSTCRVEVNFFGSRVNVCDKNKIHEVHGNFRMIVGLYGKKSTKVELQNKIKIGKVKLY